LLVNNAWDGMSSLTESLFAYVVLGERFDHWSQYVGLVMIVVGLFLLKIPWKNSGFRLPRWYKRAAMVKKSRDGKKEPRW